MRATCSVCTVSDGHQESKEATLRKIITENEHREMRLHRYYKDAEEALRTSYQTRIDALEKRDHNKEKDLLENRTSHKRVILVKVIKIEHILTASE